MADSDATDLTSLIVETDTQSEGFGDSILRCNAPGCDRPLEYSGRGRKPKFCSEHKPQRGTTRSSTRASDSVGQAVDSLSQTYRLATTLLLMVGATDAASTLSESIPSLEAQNRDFLQKDAKLVASINKVGTVGGRYGFFAAQAMTLGPVGYIAWTELTEKARARQEARASENPDLPEGFMP